MANDSLMEALDSIAKEKNISREVILSAIRNALLVACKQSYPQHSNFGVTIDPDTGDYHVYLKKTVVEDDDVLDPVEEIALSEAHDIDGTLKTGDEVNVEIPSKEFGRIAASSAKNVLMQDIHEEEHRVLKDEYASFEHHLITGIVLRKMGRSYAIDLGKIEAVLTEREQIRSESYRPGDRYKFYVVEVRDTRKGLKVYVSRTHPDLVKCLFEQEVSEIRDGIVEIRGIAREAGNRTKMAVWSNDSDVDAVGACVGMNGSRVNAVVAELHNEKIDIINWDENPARLIENALSPAKVISVMADPEEKSALVIVPDYQLSLAIGREGQNARLAAHLTGYKIDIKSETQARESGDFPMMDDDLYLDEDGYYEEEEPEEENDQGSEE